MLFPFSFKDWKQALLERFHRNASRKQLVESYFFTQVSNLYMIKFARNPHLMYLDLHDFNDLLGKFDFIRFFKSLKFSGEVISDKHAERFIKLIQWRTSQTP
jgi:hypothetical protein